MRLTHRFLGALAFATLSVAASAQIRLNELYFNDAGTDDVEYVELKGPVGASLNGYMILVVEGDGTAAGVLDIAVDLTALSITNPGGYFVLGDTAVLPTPDLLFATTTNSIENGSDTFYLVQTANPAAITALLGTNVTLPPGSTTTSIPTLATIVDIVAVTDGGATDTWYDGAQVIGPVGGVTAPNIYRCGDSPGAWDTSMFLAFDPTVDPHPWPTPAAQNENLCAPPSGPGLQYCAGDGLSSPPTTACPCGNVGAAGNGCASSFNPAGANINATGVVANDDVVLIGSGMQATGICVFLQGDAIDPNAFVFGDGITCTGGALIRLRGVALSGGSASFPVPPETITLSQRGGVTVGSGAIRSYTVFYRNAAAAFCPPATFNTSNSYQITW